MKTNNNNKKQRERRHKRIRAKILGTEEKPRLCVFRSNKHIYAQIIDDEKGVTIISASDFDIKDQGGKKTEIAQKVGELTAQKAKDHKITKVVFDRGGFRYQGRVKALAEGARKAGLIF
ncbi:MAG: 50S ribosomal protein L18 [Candidatus Pacebacteria bacterium]|nr:50S ribosomal protein L18 [Candidatus Paceibacterota bacterium]